MGRINAKRIESYQINMARLNGKRLNELNWVLTGRNPVRYELWRLFCDPVSLEEEYVAIQSNNFPTEEASDRNNSPVDSPEGPPTSEQVKFLAWVTNGHKMKIMSGI